MNLTECLCCFALRHVVGEGAERAVAVLGDHFSDRSQALSLALTRANERAWRALEIALAGESMWNAFDRADDKALRSQLKGFIDSVALPEEATRQKTRLLILAELREARKQNHLGGSLDPKALSEGVGAMARFSDPQALIEHERSQIRDMARLLKLAGYENLAWLLAQQPRANESLLVVAARYFLRREIERDPKLAHGLQLAATESLASAQQAGFQDLDAALSEHGTRLEQALVALQAQLLAAVNRVEAQVAGHGEKLDEIKALQAQVLDLVKRLDLQDQPLKPGHSLSIHNDRERQLVKELLARLRAIPARQQDAHPELFDDIGKLLVAAGDFGAARESFARAAALAPGDAARAEAHHNAYRAALEQGDSAAALRELLQALAIAPDRFAPFPTDKYEPLGILGAGGFGVTFLCRHRLSKGQVAVKALFAEELDRDVEKVLEEATTLDALKHRSIVALRDCGYAGPGHSRPYLVMEYFAGSTLEEHVKQKGPLPVDAVRGLALAVAEALAAAHGMNVLHRDIKPANLLLKADGSGGYDVRLIDFGLALKQERLGVVVGAGLSQRGGDADKAAASNTFVRLGEKDGKPTAERGWKAAKAVTSYVSPLAYEGHAYFVNPVGVLYCLDVKTGEERYAKRIDGPCWASPLAADGRVHFFGRNGTTTVVKAGAEFENLASNRLWETSGMEEKRAFGESLDPIVYGVAAADGAFDVRTGTQLIRVGKPSSKSE